jgi:hypothetical protein
VYRAHEQYTTQTAFCNCLRAPVDVVLAKSREIKKKIKCAVLTKRKLFEKKKTNHMSENRTSTSIVSLGKLASAILSHVIRLASLSYYVS